MNSFPAVASRQKKTIQALFDVYAEFYQRSFTQTSNLDSKWVSDIKKSFKNYFKQFKTSKNKKEQKLYLKYCHFNYFLQQIPDYIFTKSKKKWQELWFGKTFNSRYNKANKHFNKKIHDQGFESIANAISNVYDFSLSETLIEIQKFIDQSNEEYEGLLKKIIPSLRKKKDSTLFLSKKEKLLFYEGSWLNKQYKLYNPQNILQKILDYFVNEDIFQLK
jgi:hypothetical protein